MNIDIDNSDEDDEKNNDRPGSGHRLLGTDGAHSPSHPDTTPTPSTDVSCERSYVGNVAEPAAVGYNEDGEGTIATANTVDGNRNARDGGTPLATFLGGAPKAQSHASTTDDGGGRTDEDDSDQDNGPDPWGDGRGESRWGHRIGVGTGTSGTSGPADGDVGLALVEALGSWCASVSAYDRLEHLAPGSAAQRAAEAETEWDELERRIARSSLDVQLEEFRYETVILNTYLSSAGIRVRGKCSC